MARSRRSVRPPDLTSLFDVLFLFVFVSLVNAGVARRDADVAQAAAAKPPAPRPAPVVNDVAGLQKRALGALDAALAARTPVVARVSKDGALVQLELATRTIAVGAPLVERVADPDVGMIYLGDRAADQQLCRVVAHALGAADLHDVLVIVTPDAPLAELRVALASGLHRDADRCGPDLRGEVAIVDPSATQPPVNVPVRVPGATP